MSPKQYYLSKVGSQTKFVVRSDVMASKPGSARLHPGPGLRVKMNMHRLPAELMREYMRFPTSEISDFLNRLYAVDPMIRLLTNPNHTICGPALTVRVFPGDNLMVHKSLDVLEPGDVVVVDAGGSTLNAVLGDLISTKAKHCGAAGFVVDGLVRDLPSIQKLVDFPVFARGTTPIGPLHRGPGEINFPICLGGVVVNPGDLIVGDSGGVVVVPRGTAEELLGRLKSNVSVNVAFFESWKKGNFSSAWVDKLLTDLECPVMKWDVADPVEGGCGVKKVRCALADSIEVSIDIAGYRKDGRAAHDTNEMHV